MTGLLVTMICITISIFCYKKISNRCRNKSRGKFRTLLTASLSSALIFTITMVIGIANFFPKDQSSNIINVPKVPIFKFDTSQNMEQVHALIDKDLKENPILTQQILREIASYKEGTVDRTVSELRYVNYGVSYKDDINAIQGSQCRQELKAQLMPYKAWYEAQDWRPLEEFPDSMIKQEMYRRDIVEADYNRKKTEIENIFAKCTFSLRDTIPHLSRANAKPLIRDSYIPDRLKCVERNGGNYNICYP